MKLIRGSQAARDFMAKLRAKKKSVKKKVKTAKKTAKKAAKKIARKYHRIKKAVIGAEKHQDVKSHNYKISISGLKEDAIAKASILAKRIGFLESSIEFAKLRLKEKHWTPADKAKFKKGIKAAQKHIANYKKQLSTLKKLF